ncbi:MAG: Bug family tripartite tricarboxylate transporter substrate binding protein [Pseudorhodoplanes sp.]|uniref:Bug family tripartite tricarboxylate transporter substrate binding protein n=1 Tax=Pseudorhodoplanes sp. TaxID=1934341 RepID=UPI003D0F4D57
MRTPTNRRLLCVAAFGMWTALTVHANADSYPNRTVRIVFGLSAGSSTDVMARILAERLSQKWGQGVIIDNRPGAAGNIAADAVAKADPDGYTLLLSNNSISIAPSFYKKLNYDPVKDLIPVTQLGMTPHVLCVNPKLPIKSVEDLVDMAKKKPGDIMYSSAGIGQTDHMATALFAEMAGIKMTHVPYRGGPPALQAVMAGEVALDFPGIAAALPFLKDGTIRCIAVSSNKRSPAVPDLPTLNEAGIKGYDHSLWNGLFAPAGTPPEILKKISAGFSEVLQDPGVVKRLSGLGIEPVGSSPDAFNRYFQAEVAKWADVIKKTGIQAASK